MTLQEWLSSLGMGAMSKLVSSALTLICGILIIRILMALVKKTLEKTRLEKAAHSLITSVVRVVLYLLLGLMVASGLGIDVTGVVALASVLSLVVSLSVQDVLTNIIGGFTLLGTKPFVSGDYVEIAGQSGTVQEIGLAYTKLTTPDNKLISLPNSSVVASQVVNYSTTGTRRVEIQVSASYDAPIEKVLEALVQAGTVEYVLPDPAPVAVIAEYGESVISYSLRVWTRSEHYWDVYHTVNPRIKAIFDREGIAMSYPHLNVHLDK